MGTLNIPEYENTVGLLLRDRISCVCIFCRFCSAGGFTRSAVFARRRYRPPGRGDCAGRGVGKRPGCGFLFRFSWGMEGADETKKTTVIASFDDFERYRSMSDL